MIADEALNLAARVLLRLCAPLTARDVLTRLGQYLPQRTTRDELVRAAASLSARGSCLSRSLALAATAPAADVVIGVRPSPENGVDAHAWLEMDGQPLREDDPRGEVIARLPGRCSPLRAA